jgi:hypothetical protein
MSIAREARISKGTISRRAVGNEKAQREGFGDMMKHPLK